MSILEVKDIQKSYGKDSVLKGITFTIEEPQIIALVGPNGSGKSTLLNIITNIIQSDSGEVSILGRSNKNPSIFKKMSYMQDNTVLYDYLTGYDHLQFIAEVQSLSKERIFETARLIGNESYLHKKVKNYSLGMKQHLLLAMAVLNQPKLLILDEPLNGLDPTSAIRVRKILLQLAEEETTILLSSHNLGEIDRITSNILFLKSGQLIEEDISMYEQTVYFIHVDNPVEAVNILQNQQINLNYDESKLKLQLKGHSLKEILNILLSNNIGVLDIEKHVSGSEDRYKQIFGSRGQTDETLKV